MNEPQTINLTSNERTDEAAKFASDIGNDIVHIVFKHWKRMEEAGLPGSQRFAVLGLAWAKVCAALIGATGAGDEMIGHIGLSFDQMTRAILKAVRRNPPHH